MDAFVEELIDPDGLPKETIRRCLEHPDRVTPIFLSLLQQYANNPDLNDERADALFFIIHILGELGEKGAFVPLIEFLLGDQHRVENILGDAVTENLTQILISVFDGRADRLYQVMNNPVVDEFVRYSTFMAWIHAVASGQIGSEEAEHYLLDCFETLQPQGKSYVWVAWLDCIAKLGLEHLKPLVRQAFDTGRMPDRAIDWQDFEDILGGRLTASDPMEFLERERIRPFEDTIGTLAKWHAFSPEYLQSKRQAQHAIKTAQIADNTYRNVGRNDPCPCGSGKKFKKCCLN